MLNKINLYDQQLKEEMVLFILVDSDEIFLMLQKREGIFF